MKDAIDTVNRKFKAAMDAGDAAGLAAVYTSNGNALPPNNPTATGTADIQTFWQAVIDMGIANVRLKTVELDDLGAIINELGEFELKTADGTIADAGKYIVVWKQENGEWRMANGAGTMIFGTAQYLRLETEFALLPEQSNREAVCSLTHVHESPRRGGSFREA